MSPKSEWPSVQRILVGCAAQLPDVVGRAAEYRSERRVRSDSGQNGMGMESEKPAVTVTK